MRGSSVDAARVTSGDPGQVRSLGASLITVNGNQLNVDHPLIKIDPDHIYLAKITSGIANYQKQISNAKWEPGLRRGAGFAVMHNNLVLGVIYFSNASAMTPVTNHLFPEMTQKEYRQELTNHYVDMTICVGLQPLAWYWNLGKLCAMTATALGDYCEWDNFSLKGVITTSYYGVNRGTQYSGIYKHLGDTKGQMSHTHIPTEVYKSYVQRAKDEGYRTPPYPEYPIGHPYAFHGDAEHKFLPRSKWISTKGYNALSEEEKSNFIQKEYGPLRGDGSNGKIRTIHFLMDIYPEFRKEYPEGTANGQSRGIYYAPAGKFGSFDDVINLWYGKAVKRYEKKRYEDPPYTSGNTGK